MRRLLPHILSDQGHKRPLPPGASTRGSRAASAASYVLLAYVWFVSLCLVCILASLSARACFLCINWRDKATLVSDYYHTLQKRILSQ